MLAHKLTSSLGLKEVMLFKWYIQEHNIECNFKKKDEIIKCLYSQIVGDKPEPFKSGKKTKPSKPYIKSQSVLDAEYNDFYQTSDWLWIRKKILRLYGRECMKCGAKNTELHIDHIKPRSLRIDLQLSPSNLQVLCLECNMEKSNKNSDDYRTETHLRKLDAFLSR
jgi:hypothetical protein